jgi:hypothetical protein
VAEWSIAAVSKTVIPARVSEVRILSPPPAASSQKIEWSFRIEMAAKKNTTFEDTLNLTSLEKEVITLKATMDMINDMVNWETMSFTFRDPDSSVIFHTRTHKAFFNILLVDLLSIPSEFFNDKKNYIERLKDICENPLMGKLAAKKDIFFLRKSVNAFATWLLQTVVVEKRWFPSIDLQIDLSIQRQAFVTMCGNISKHNFTQQTRQAVKLQKILEKNEKFLSLDKCLIALEDFQKQFYDDIFSYHAATLAEFLNNIRWGIFLYASAERERRVVNWHDEKLNLNRYKYEYPSDITSELGETYYWNLMNDVIRPPYIQQFQVTKYLKMQY